MSLVDGFKANHGKVEVWINMSIRFAIWFSSRMELLLSGEVGRYQCNIEAYPAWLRLDTMTAHTEV